MNIIGKILNDNLILENDTIRIYPGVLESNKILDLFQIYSNPSNVFGYTAPIYNLKDFANILIDKISRHQNKINGYVCYFIELKENNKVIGVRNIILDGVYNFRNEKIDHKKNVIAEIIINKDFWKKGFAIQSSELIFSYLKTLGINHICTFIDINNFRAISLNKKLNFEETDKLELKIIYDYDQDYEINCQNLDNSRIFIKCL